MFAKNENLSLEFNFKIFTGVKIFGKEDFLGSTLNHSAPKSVDRADVAKTVFSDSLRK